jgi:hypothetical protein
MYTKPLPPLFQTQNTALAVTLATCGVPFATDPNGNAIPFLNIYDAARLELLGYKGWSLREAAHDAWKKGKPGKIIYNFQRTEELEKVIKGFDKRSAILAHPEFKDTDTTLPHLSPEEYGALCCQLLHNRKMLLEGWKTAMPHISIMGATHSQSENGREVTVGSFKVFSLNASPETLKKLGLS